MKKVLLFKKKKKKRWVGSGQSIKDIDVGVMQSGTNPSRNEGDVRQVNIIPSIYPARDVFLEQQMIEETLHRPLKKKRRRRREEKSQTAS